ncbi:MAG: 3-hydroxyacyl-ACP dehydratase FabZ [Bdellovibrionales bacterium]|nr:3-hydroxyacyl-ACP dehydratase FabZ [Bdellovibrionales bacterium]
MSNGEARTMKVEEIRKVLPHRYPFQLVDRIIDMDEPRDGSREGRWVKGLKNVTINEPFFPGHFPHRPVMPGVLIIEAMAQTGALACYRPNDPEMDVAIVKVSSARFRAPVVPGDSVIMSVVVKKDKANMIVMDCQAEVDGKIVASAEIVAYVVPIGSLN